MRGRDNVVAHLLEKGAEMDARDKVRIDMYLGSRYRLCLFNSYILRTRVEYELIADEARSAESAIAHIPRIHKVWNTQV
jgi:hypothetical protein